VVGESFQAEHLPYIVSKLEDYSPSALDQAAQDVLTALKEESAAVHNEADWKAFRDRWMARKNGILTQMNDAWLKSSPNTAKREVGQLVNALRSEVETIVERAKASALPVPTPERVAKPQAVIQKQLSALDITLPGIRRPVGSRHPVLKAMDEVVGVFKAMGYSVEQGPEVETDYYNFEALNFPANHPARDTQDTIFIAGQDHKPSRDRLLLRTHTSPVQIRAMQKAPPPIRVICPGKVHRHDTPDASHSPLFHQIEGLAVDTNITFSDLKGTLDHAMKSLFGSSVKTRFYPSFFPFTEPSADVQISCPFCGGKGCRTCKQSGWIELLGCGMVDPNVFEFVRANGYDPKKISGFAFGMGVDRIAMLKYGIDDIQLLFQGDVRFLEQFA